MSGNFWDVLKRYSTPVIIYQYPLLLEIINNSSFPNPPLFKVLIEPIYQNSDEEALEEILDYS